MLERAGALLDEAVTGDAAWLRTLSPGSVEEHRERLLTVAAYRDRYGVADRDPRPLGGPPASSGNARTDWRIARAAIRPLLAERPTAPTDATEPTSSPMQVRGL
jgi:hypothetical protein